MPDDHLCDECPAAFSKAPPTGRCKCTAETALWNTAPYWTCKRQTVFHGNGNFTRRCMEFRCSAGVCRHARPPILFAMGYVMSVHPYTIIYLVCFCVSRQPYSKADHKDDEVFGLTEETVFTTDILWYFREHRFRSGTESDAHDLCALKYNDVASNRMTPAVPYPHRT
jgi:hypothetical protein